MNNHNCISVSSVTCPNPEPGFQPSAGACIAQASRSISLDSLYCKGGSQQQQLRFSLAISSQLHSHESALPPQGIRDMCQSCQHRITALCSCPLPCHHRVDSHLSSSFSFLASPLGSSWRRRPLPSTSNAVVHLSVALPPLPPSSTLEAGISLRGSSSFSPPGIEGWRWGGEEREGSRPPAEFLADGHSRQQCLAPCLLDCQLPGVIDLLICWSRRVELEGHEFQAFGGCGGLISDPHEQTLETLHHKVSGHGHTPLYQHV